MILKGFTLHALYHLAQVNTVAQWVLKKTNIRVCIKQFRLWEGCAYFSQPDVEGTLGLSVEGGNSLHRLNGLLDG
jgi:hypothetical protein